MKEHQKQALEYLIAQNVFVPMRNFDLYHGRARQKSETGPWQVVPGFDNTNGNVANIPVLYATTSYKAAEQYAENGCAKSKDAIPEVHKIVSSDDNALVFNCNCKFSSDIKVALTTLLQPGHSIYTPIEFEQRDVYPEVLSILTNVYQERIKNNPVPQYITYNDVACAISKVEHRFSNVKNLDKLVTNIAGAYNAKISVCDGNAFREYISGSKSMGDYSNLGPINSEFLSAFWNEYGIVGVFDEAVSGKINDHIHRFFLFDTYKVQTLESYEQRKKEIFNKYSGISNLLGNLIQNANFKDKNLLQIDSPEELISRFKSLGNLKDFMDLPAYVFEGFTIAEHTESVLRVFENSYAFDIPNDLKPFIRLAILLHDIGKGSARGNGLDEKQATAEMSTMVMDSLGISKDKQRILQFVIGESQEYTTNYFVKKVDYADFRLTQKCTELLQSEYGEIVSEDLITGLSDICKILQTCDSGAYTRFATTSRISGDYHNANDEFTKNFTPSGIARKKLRMIEPKKDSQELEK